MIHLKKRLAFGLAAGLLAACITVPVYGASRKNHIYFTDDQGGY